MPLELGELSNLSPKAKKTKKARKSKVKKGLRGNWRRLGSWWICRKCERQISTRDQSPIPVMICKECGSNANTEG